MKDPELAAAQADIKARGTVMDRLEATLAERAKLQNREADYDLGVRYAKGRGVPRDDVQAFKFLRKAAEQGHVAAQRHMGLAYFGGAGVPQDYLQGHAWLNLAAAQGDQEARALRSKVTAQLTPDQIVHAQQLASELMRRIEIRRRGS